MLTQLLSKEKTSLRKTADRKEGFEMLCNFLKDNPECRYSIGELEEIMEGNLYDEAEGCTWKHLERKLREYFGDNLLITSLPGKPSVIKFHKVFSGIGHQSWYDERNPNKSAKQRITGTAAADISYMPYDCDVYSPPHSPEFSAICEAVPETLHKLIGGTISQPGYHDQNNTLTQRKVMAIVRNLLKQISFASHLKKLICLDSFWLASYALGITPAPVWSGFNQLAAEHQNNVFHVSDVVSLPFINLKPSDMSSIYIVLLFAHK